MIKKGLMVTGLAIIAAALLLAGCGNEDNGGGADVSQQDLIDNIISAEEGIQTGKFNLQMGMDVNGSGEGETVNIDMAVDGDGVIDNVNRKMRMTMNMDMKMKMLGMDMDQEYAMEMYSMGNTMYMKTSEMMGMPEQWIKSEVPEDYWQSEDMIAQQTELLKEANLNISDGGKVNGRACYKVELVPDLETLYETMMQQPGMGGSAVDDLPEGMDISDLIEMIDDMKVVQWYDKDTFFLMKADMEMSMSMSGDDMGMLGAGGDMEMNIAMTVNFSDYNKPVTIELPPEAAEAIDVTDMYGNGEGIEF